MEHDRIEDYIRTIPDYPRPGILFRDITTLLASAEGLRRAVDLMVHTHFGRRIDLVAGIEARGFILGGAIAHQQGVGFVPIRKKGKLPRATLQQAYELEYGTDVVEIHEDAIWAGANVLIVDDLLATGGTAEAAVKLIRQAGGSVSTASFVIELGDLPGRSRLENLDLQVLSVCTLTGS